MNSHDEFSIIALSRPFLDGKISLAPIEKGGSARKFYRVSTAQKSLIATHYSTERTENLHYAALADYLASHGLAVPKIYLHDEANRIILMQDLGSADLWSHRNEDWDSCLFPLYQLALDQIARLHTTVSATIICSAQETRHHAECRSICPPLEMPFDADLYIWEQNYFFENYIGLLLGRQETRKNFPALEAIAHCLAAKPRVLVHRDFQSQNIIIHADAAWLIDFQGMRYGLPHYDLASLVFDPYMPLEDSQRTDLIDYYKKAAPAIAAAPDFDETLLLCAAQRLMQALGAYGNLGIRQGKSSFLDHVAPARTTLSKILIQVPSLATLAQQYL